MRLTTIVLLAGLGAVPGCGALSVLQGEPERDLFELRAPTAIRCNASTIGELVIEPPKARGTLDSDRIMIRPSALQAQYLPDAQWGDTVPSLLQRLLVESLGATGSYTHVGRAPLGLSGDVAMTSEIGDFNAELTPEGGVIVKLSVEAQMVREMGADVIASRAFIAIVPSAGTRTADLIPAFDAATRQLITEMRGWSLAASGVSSTNCR